MENYEKMDLVGIVGLVIGTAVTGLYGSSSEDLAVAGLAINTLSGMLVGASDRDTAIGTLAGAVTGGVLGAGIAIGTYQATL